MPVLEVLGGVGGLAAKGLSGCFCVACRYMQPNLGTSDDALAKGSRELTP